MYSATTDKPMDNQGRMKRRLGSSCGFMYVYMYVRVYTYIYIGFRVWGGSIYICIYVCIEGLTV